MIPPGGLERLVEELQNPGLHPVATETAAFSQQKTHVSSHQFCPVAIIMQYEPRRCCSEKLRR